MKHLIRVVVILFILTGTLWMIPRHFSAAAFAAEGGINWKTSWDEAKNAADESSRPVLILFTNPERCPPCRMLEANTFPDAKVAAFINENFVPFLAHTGRKESHVLGREFGIRSIPSFIVVDSNKKEITRTVGYRTPEQLIEFLKPAVKTKPAAKTKPAVKADTIEKPANEKPASKKKEEQTGNTLPYVVIILIVLLGTVYFVLRAKRNKEK